MKPLVFTENARLLIAHEIANIPEKYRKPFNSTHEGYAVLLEEVDELWDEVKSNGSNERLKAEAVQVAAMAIRFIQELTDPAIKL